MADTLDVAASATGDPRFAHAAGILRGAPAGRRRIDDGAALDLVRNLVASGAKSRRSACVFAATLYTSSAQVSAMADRLQRKLRQN